MTVRVCRKCGAVLVFFGGSNLPGELPFLGGSICGCPMLNSREESKYRLHRVGEGALVIYDKEDEER